LASLTEVEHSKDTLRPGFVPKISRELVTQLFTDIAGAVNDDEKLLEIFARCATQNQEVDHTDDVHVPRRPPVPEGTQVEAVQDEPQAQAKQDRTFDGKVLVTGAAGHLGANLVRRLLSEGRDVRVMLREGSNNAAMSGLPVEKVFGDLRQEQTLREAVKGCETVFHCAATISTLQGDAEHQKRIFDCNVVGTRNLLLAGAEAGVKRAVVTGSIAAEQPGDSAERKLPYAASKAQMEQEVLKAVDQGVDAVIACSGAILGPHDYKPSAMGQTLIDYAHGKLRAYIPGGVEFVSADDICQGHLLAMRRGESGQRYTFTTEYVSMEQLMGLFEEVSGRSRPKVKLPPALMAQLAEVSTFVMSNFFPNKTQRFTPGAVAILRSEQRVDITRAQQELGYAPTSVRAAIHQAYADFARRGLVPGGPTMVSTSPAGDHTPESGDRRGKTAAA